MLTQAEIARKLGVSRQLVTFALSGYPQISQKSRKRILAAARKMGYSPNLYARGLKKGRSGIIGLWIPDQISTHYTHVARELNRLVKAAHRELIVSEVSVAKEQQMLSHVPMDGIIVVDAPDQVAIYRKSALASRVPVISMGANYADNGDAVQVDLYAGTLEAMKHLIDSGFQRIAHATFMREDSPYGDRRKGYVKAMQKAKLKPEFIYYPLTEQQRVITRQSIKDYIRENGRPDAIFCHSDDVALGIYRGLCDMKLRVPEDVALVGCDGIQDTEYLECQLTTLVQPVATMCATAWQFLMQRMERTAPKKQKKKLVPQLIVRDSSTLEHRNGSSS
jgi:LacI family transcriptional regulator